MPISGSPIYWSSSNEDIVSVNAKGMITAHQEGIATITAQDLDARQASTLVTVTTNPQTASSFGRAVIIAGGGNHVTNTLFPYTSELSRNMYKLLKALGYKDEDIIYMTPEFVQDLDGDGENDNADGMLVDYSMDSPQTELGQAIQSIAASLLPGQKFVLYFHGHGLPEPTRLPTSRINSLQSII